MSSPTSSRRRSAGVGLIVLLALRFVLGVYYSLAVPPWESYDEPGHFQYARYLAVTGHLLDPNDPEAQSIWSRFQPPLYYLLVAPFIASFDLGQHALEPELNPYFTGGIAGLNYAVAFASPTPDQSAQLAALTTMRLVGVVISTASTIFMFLAARRLWPRSAWGALAAASLYAFWPQFVFIGSMATNDLLITSLAAVLVYLIVRTQQEGLTLVHAGLLAAVTGAALLTKLNGLAFVVPTGLVIVLAAVTQRRTAIVALGGLLALVAVALVLLSGMDFVTGQILQLSTLTRLLTNLTDGATVSARFLDILTYGRRTFVASYGWGNVEAWSFIYPLFDAVIGIGFVAAALTRLRRTSANARGAGSSLLIAASLLVSLILLAVALSIAQNDRYLVVGRYLLPALPGLTLIACAGWYEVIPTRIRTHVVVIAAALQAAISWAIPVGILSPAYDPPQPASAADLAAIDTGTAAVFAPGMRLLGAGFAEADGPEAAFGLTLCFQADHVIVGNFPLRLTLIGPDNQGYGDYTTYPGRGNYPTSLWIVGQPFCERYSLRVRGDYPAPAQGSVSVSFLEHIDGITEVPATSPAGVLLPTSPRVPVVVHGQTQGSTPTPAQPLAVRFGDTIRLEGITLTPLADGTGLTATLFWRSTTSLSADISVFAHLRRSPADLYLQDDSRPRDDHYPTRYWRAGELILDSHEFRFPSDPEGPLSLYVGLYTPTARLPALAETGVRLTNDEVVVPAWPLR